MTKRGIMAPGNPISPDLEKYLRFLNGEPHPREPATDAPRPPEKGPTNLLWELDPFGDPLRFMQYAAKQLDVVFNFTYHYHSLRELVHDGHFFASGASECHGDFAFEGRFPRGHPRRLHWSASNQLSIDMQVQDRYRDAGTGLFMVPQDIQAYASQASRERKSAAFPLMCFDRLGLDIYGPFSRQLDLHISYGELDGSRHTLEKGAANLLLFIGQAEPGRFVLSDLAWGFDAPCPKTSSFRKKFADIEKKGYNDWRPYLHRILELYRRLPRAEWHNPVIYHRSLDEELANLAKREPYQAVLETALKTLFSEAERSRLEEQIAGARLTLQRLFASIPRLNLGPTTLPSAGQREATTEYVVQGGLLLVEALAQRMGRAEAEALVEQRLVHYLLQQRGGQLNPRRARNLLAELRPAAASEAAP